MDTTFISKQWADFKKNVSSKRHLFVIAATLTATQMSAQQSYTFTAAGASGNAGPTLGQITTAYALTNLNGSVTIGSPGIQLFTIPSTGAYAVEAYGAQGFGLSGVGGRGARMSGEFNFTAGQIIKIVVGQQGSIPVLVTYNAQYSGGGGSFVTDNANVPFVVAGGGGGNWSAALSAVSDAPITTSGNTGTGVGATAGVGGTGGSGGTDISFADGGAGFTGNGLGTAGGISFVNGAGGGFTTSGIGGFGGGGGTSSFNNRRCGGGGGYSGGGAAQGATTGFPEAGGGGSYNAGTNQSNSAGANTGDGTVVISKLCNVTLSAGTNPICFGKNVTLSTNASAPIAWSTQGSGASIVVSPTVTTTYTVSGTGQGTLVCIGTAAIIVSVTPLPVVSAMVNPPLLCVGKSATVTGAGAITYTWNNGPTGVNAQLSPAVTTVYNFLGADVFGCVNSGTVLVNVSTNTLTVSSNTTICDGKSLNIAASGASTYTWSTGAGLSAIFVSPSLTTVFSVLGTDINNCVLSNSLSVTVNSRPTVIASSDKDNVCKGESVTLSATGAANYVWQNVITGIENGASITKTLSIDVPYTYTVTGTDANGCSKSSVVVVQVNRCTGVNEEKSKTSFASLYPNPNSGSFTVESVGGVESIAITDLAGRVLASYSSNTEKTEVNMNAFANGIYYAKIHTGNFVQVIKVVKQ